MKITLNSVWESPLYLDKNYYNPDFLYDGELWLPIPDWNGFFEISNWGRVRSLSRRYVVKNIIRTPEFGKDGYLVFTLNTSAKKKKIIAHRVVGKLFIPNPTNKPQINHKKAIKVDNRVSQIEWTTEKENREHAVQMGLVSKAWLGKTGKNHPSSRIVYQYDLEAALIEEWESATEVSKSFGVNRSTIAKYCREDKISFGFRWSYNKN